MPQTIQHAPIPQQVIPTTGYPDDRLTRFATSVLSREQIRKLMENATRANQVARAQSLLAGSMW